MDDHDVKCVICHDPSIDKLATVTDTGYAALLEFSRNFDRDYPGLSASLKTRKLNNQTIQLHRNCQKRLYRLNKKRKACGDCVNDDNVVPSPKKTRSRFSFV